MKKNQYHGFGKLLLICFCCIGSIRGYAQQVDQQATPETKNLYNKLHQLWGRSILFGHQDDLAYGVNWKYEPGRSDVKEVAGDYPALQGLDAAGLEKNAAANINGIPFSTMKEYIEDTYDKGGLTSLSWHMDNPVSGKNAWDTTAAVKAILPGGVQHQLYKASLDKFAEYVSGLKGADGKAIPLLFRPFHECSGSWFWWGNKSCTPEEFKTLFRFTVTYLRDVKQLHNLIYIFNVNDFETESDYLERYPGDGYADMISFDSYQFNADGVDFSAKLRKRLEIQQRIAESHGKIAALAETGYVEIPDPLWWTNVLAKAMEGLKISHVLIWRNAGFRKAEEDYHYYAPYQGHASAANFIQFYQLPGMMFLKKAAAIHLYQAATTK